MKQRLLFIIVAFFATVTAHSKVAINATNFPDENFRTVVAGTDIDKDADGYLSDEEIAAVTQLDVREKGIQNLKGIEFFTGLKELICYGNELTSLDVSKNTELTRLACGQNQIKSLDLSKNTKMENLHCANNQLTALDVSMMPNLWRLYCRNNKLTKLDVTKNTKLTELTCSENQLTALDVSNNTELTWLDCYHNSLTSLDVSKNTALKDLHCFDNQLTSLNVTKNTAMTWLHCDNNELTSLDVTKNTALTLLDCFGNKLTALDVSKNTELTELRCWSNELTSLNLSYLDKLETVWCDYNKLSSLNVKGCTSLKDLNLFHNAIKGTEMDALIGSLPDRTPANDGMMVVMDEIEEQPEGNVMTKDQVSVAVAKGWSVKEIYNISIDDNGNHTYHLYNYEGSDPGIAIDATNFPDENFRAVVAGTDIDKDANGYLSDGEIAAVTELDVKEKGIQNLKGIEFFTGLKELFCQNNELTSLDVSKNTELTRLACGQNQIKSLDLSKNTKIENLHCANNQLTALDVSMMPNLWRLYCLNNKLTKLDVTKNTKLTELNCCENQLTALDVSKNTKLTTLYCYDNSLTSLDVSKNTALTELNCFGNKLTALDVSKNTALTELNCFDNKLTALDVSKSTALIELYCYRNQLASLDVSKNTALKKLSCYENQLVSLNVSKNTALQYLYCFNNQIKGDKMQALVNSLPTVTEGYFYVIDTKNSNEQNVCTEPQVKIATDKGWTVNDYNGGGSPQEYAGSDPGIAINATNFPDENFRTVVAGTSIDKDADGYLSAKEIAAVTKLDVSNQDIESLKGVEFFNALEKLYCDRNKLTDLDVSKNTKLTELSCWGNRLTNLDVSKNTKLTELYCDNNQLTDLDVSKNTKLTKLHCYGNQIKGVQMQALVNSLPKVTGGEFYVIDTKNGNEQNKCTEPQVKIAKGKGWTVYDWNGGNKQKYAGSDPGIAINATNFPDKNFRSVIATATYDADADGYLSTEEIDAATTINVENKNIADLKGIEHFTALTSLNCGANQLSSLDVTKNTKLTELSCENNQLTSLDVSNNTELTNLDCYDNELTSLDVSTNSQLITLDCKGNELTALDVVNNTELTWLDCSHNQLTALDVTTNTELKGLACFSNQIKGKQMQALVNSLPMVTNGTFYVVDTNDGSEKNVITEPQVNIAKGKGWTVYDYNGGSRQEYAGSDPGIAIDATNFPDENFRSVIATTTYDADADGYLSTEEIDAVTTIDAENKNIADLKGIEHFTALTTLRCGVNQLMGLDVSKNTALTALYCYGNQIQGEQMQALVNSLPTVTDGEFYVVDTNDGSEKNVITEPQVKIAKGKGWTVYDWNGGSRQEYAASVESAIGGTEVSAEEKDHWYSLDGKRLSGKPTKKGIYVRNGRKVVVK